MSSCGLYFELIFRVPSDDIWKVIHGVFSDSNYTLKAQDVEILYKKFADPRCPIEVIKTIDAYLSSTYFF